MKKRKQFFLQKKSCKATLGIECTFTGIIYAKKMQKDAHVDTKRSSTGVFLGDTELGIEEGQGGRMKDLEKEEEEEEERKGRKESIRLWKKEDTEEKKKDEQ